MSDFRLSRSIIHANRSSTVFVVDIPASIAAAQHLCVLGPASTHAAYGDDCKVNRRLISCAPLQRQYPSLEPKSVKARQRVKQRLALSEEDERRDGEYTRLVLAALEEKKQADVREFCLGRCVDEQRKSGDQGRTQNLKRKRADVEVEQGMVRGDAVERTEGRPTERRVHGASYVPDSLQRQEREVAAILKDIVDSSGQPRSVRWDHSPPTKHSFRRDARLEPYNCNCLNDWVSTIPEDPRIVTNASDSNLDILAQYSVPRPTGGEAPVTYRFHIPPQSQAINAPLANTACILTALSAYVASSTATAIPVSRKLDLVLLDPPWPNRSARRSSTYAGIAHSSSSHSATSLEELQDTVLALGLVDVLAEDAHVAIWITSRPAVRVAALEMMHALGAELVEEWLWVKVIESGEPTCKVEGVGRKCWEVLLIGRRGGKPQADNREGSVRGDGQQDQGRVKRRIIFGVPDLHSRKPCLRELFEQLLWGAERGQDLKVLELFARYMVAGWTSWGDEALKFQWEGCWK